LCRTSNRKELLTTTASISAATDVTRSADAFGVHLIKTTHNNINGTKPFFHLTSFPQCLLIHVTFFGTPFCASLSIRKRNEAKKDQRMLQQKNIFKDTKFLFLVNI
jgi:hypothetical protein